MDSQRWQFWIDVGGTFTDCLALAPDGHERQLKVLSSSVTKGTATARDSNTLEIESRHLGGNGFWDSCPIQFLDDRGTVAARRIILGSAGQTLRVSESAGWHKGDRVSFEILSEVPSPILAVHMVTGKPLQQKVSPCDVFLGTTKGTNALLTRTGARTGLVTSFGLRDFLTIGDQSRQNLFDLVAGKSEPLFSATIEINERILADGTIEIAPQRQDIREQLLSLKKSGIESLAICLIHSYCFPDHERLVADVANEIGFKDVSLSSDVASLIQLVPRGETTVLDAYLNPVLAGYLNRIQILLGAESDLKLMTSSGALTTRELFSGKDSVLSGPAGGAVGSARVAEQLGFNKSIGFDMGGTSTDVSRYDGEFQLDFESRKANVRIMTPMLSIETVAAGGGSICRFDGTRLLVGPESAGSQPGPACYGAGGPLSVTDINLFLGRLDNNHFPFSLDEQAVRLKITEIAGQLHQAGSKLKREEIAAGFLQIANHNMAMAIQNVSASRGVDPRDYVLVSFGGAGGQHCCGVADCIGIKKILVHKNCSILSAIGIQLSDQSLSEAQSILKVFSRDLVQKLEETSQMLKENVRERLTSSGVQETEIEYEVSVDLRYLGTDSAINIKRVLDDSLTKLFSSAHEEYYGYTQNRPIEVVAVRVKGTCYGNRLDAQNLDAKPKTLKGTDYQNIYCNGEKLKAAVFSWAHLQNGDRIEGPAIIGDSLTSTIIDPEWSALVLADKQLLLSRTSPRPETQSESQDFSQADPIELEIFNKHFEVIAEQMGQVLQKTAISVNVKQRLDFSCAVFSSGGDLVVNAPHIPVHLGAMAETVKATIRLNERISDGDVFVTNDPYDGGSHLPDITVLTPVFINSDQPVFWVASRAHHAELGGVSPGSMPANATQLQEEGVIIRNLKLIDRRKENFEELSELLRHSMHPSRNPAENIADVAAQVAANNYGVGQLRLLVEAQTQAKVDAYMRHIRAAAERKTRLFLAEFPDGQYECEDQMDDGTLIRVKLSIENDELKADFAGTAPVHTGNLNANRAIVSSAVMYVLRCLLGEDIPLNAGILEPVTIELPECFLNPTRRNPHGHSPAVVGGNVETSQRIVDVLLSAFAVAAASQGTMNNWLVGDQSFGYYETVGGGSGASRYSNGYDAVHSHMSNTRLTDPEVLESRYPLVLREFRIRNTSGGAGIHTGGNGMIREIEFQKPLTLTLLTSRRTTQPFGLINGQPGSAGENWLIGIDGKMNILPPQCQVEVAAGERLRLLTPGGGGFGRQK